MVSSLIALHLVLAAPRLAVVVGSNSPVGDRPALRFAHRDARDVASVLVASGGFHDDEVEVLLDQGPRAVIASLERARAKLKSAPGAATQGMLVFYYSGHADEHALYPGGAPLPLDELRGQLADEGSGVRIGIIDACRGGGWTLAKGLTPTEPFSVGFAGLSSEGTALLASSSGVEDAHETDVLQGSFFTHHLVAGLRGAADQSGDGQVTLSEAFAYANRFTVRDTATRTKTPQHPSFDLRLRGRQDVVLTSVAANSTQLLVAQREGPIEVVQLATGVTVIEGVAGAHLLRLALPAGAYLVRRVRGDQVLSREVEVKRGEATSIDESALSLVGVVDAPKGVAPGRGERVMGPLQVGVGGLVDPFDVYVRRVGPSVAFTWLLVPGLGLRVRGAYLWPLETAAAQQLLRDFGVLPTSLAPYASAVADVGLTWQPVLMRASNSEIYAGLTAGPAAMVLADVAHTATSFSLGVTFGAELGWVFSLPGRSSLGVAISFQETLGARGDGRPGVSSLSAFGVNAVGSFGRAP